jgi:hypothetical protein
MLSSGEEPMTTFLRVLLGAVLCSSAACDPESNPLPPIGDQQLCTFALGRTTVDEVVGALGPPQGQLASTDPVDALQYSYDRLSGDQLQTTVFHFDKGGVLVAVERAQRGGVRLAVPSCLTTAGGM